MTGGLLQYMKRSNTENDSLFSSHQRGGVVGGAGYNFQDAYIIKSIPGWLLEPTFKSLIKEGFDDVDVTFGSADGDSTWHYQLKDHEVSVGEFREVLKRFTVAAQRPGINATRFVLGCCGLERALASIWRKITEYRGALKSHSEAALEPSKTELLTQLAKHKLSLFEDLLFQRVVIESEAPGLPDSEACALKERFRGSFILLPLFHNEPGSVLDSLFDRLLGRIKFAIRDGISRQELEAIIATELAGATKGGAHVVYLHGWARQVYDVAPDEEIDWTPYFDHATLRVPEPETWETKLLSELQAVRDRFDLKRQRSIWLRARAPLSAGLAFGHAFPEAAGYNIRIQQPTPGATEAIQYWETDVPIEQDAILSLHEVIADPNGEDVVVAIGVTDDPRPRVEQYLGQAGLRIRAGVYVYPAAGPSATSVNGQTVGAFATAVKRVIRRVCNLNSPRIIHLFYLGPLGLAVLLGQKLNGLTDIQCYERDRADGYTPSCRLRA